MYVRTYQCKEGSHIISMYFDFRFDGYRGRKQLMAVIDLLVGVVSDCNSYALTK